jgi:hypothetical protein
MARDAQAGLVVSSRTTSSRSWGSEPPLLPRGDDSFFVVRVAARDRLRPVAVGRRSSSPVQSKWATASSGSQAPSTNAARRVAGEVPGSRSPPRLRQIGEGLRAGVAARGRPPPRGGSSRRSRPTAPGPARDGVAEHPGRVDAAGTIGDGVAAPPRFADVQDRAGRRRAERVVGVRPRDTRRAASPPGSDRGADRGRSTARAPGRRPASRPCPSGGSRSRAAPRRRGPPAGGRRAPRTAGPTRDRAAGRRGCRATTTSPGSDRRSGLRRARRRHLVAPPVASAADPRVGGDAAVTTRCGATELRGPGGWPGRRRAPPARRRAGPRRGRRRPGRSAPRRARTRAPRRARRRSAGPCRTPRPARGSG